MNLTDISSGELAVFNAKLESTLNEFQHALQKLGQISVLGHATFDADAKRRNKITVKLEAIGATYNQVQLEIESRIKTKLGLDLELETMSEIMYEIDERYYRSVQEHDSKKKQGPPVVPLNFRNTGKA